MTARTTAYRVTTCSAPMAGKAPIEPLATRPLWRTHWRQIVTVAALTSILFAAVVLASVAGGIA